MGFNVAPSSYYDELIKNKFQELLVEVPYNMCIPESKKEQMVEIIEDDSMTDISETVSKLIDKFLEGLKPKFHTHFFFHPVLTFRPKSSDPSGLLTINAHVAIKCFSAPNEYRPKKDEK